MLITCNGLARNGRTTGIAVAVGTGERHQLGSGRCETASTGDLNLSTLRVELLVFNVASIIAVAERKGYTHGRKRVESDRLKADEIVARWDG